MKDGCGVAEQQTRRAPCNFGDVGWLLTFVLEEGWTERRRTMLLWPGPVLCQGLQCAVAARSDASMDYGQSLAGIAAHVRVLDLHRQILTGLDAQIHISVRNIHEAEIIGTELSLWLLGHRDFHDCREVTSNATEVAWCTQPWWSTVTVKVHSQTGVRATNPWCASYKLRFWQGVQGARCSWNG